MARRSVLLFACFVVAPLVAGCDEQQAKQSAGNPSNGAALGEKRQDVDAPPTPPNRHLTDGEPKLLTTEYLANVVQIHEKVISGAQPEGDAAYAELRSLGVKTIISVDGAKPDVERASKYGLRYVHLPHGYDGIPDERVKELAKAVRDLDGPIFIHCHHGKHRSPAAATVACVAANLLRPESALSILHLAGTSENYRGLYESADTARPLEKALLDQLQVEFHETMELPPLAEEMVAVEQTHDHLEEIAAAGWRTPAENPDLAPVHEALLLREHFTELLRADYLRERPASFREILRDSEEVARQLQRELQTWQPTTDQTAPPTSMQTLADRITANCKACHTQFRDVPLSAK